MTNLTVVTEPNREMLGLKFLHKAIPRVLAEENPCGLRDECDRVLSSLDPIKPHEFALHFERMLVHYWAGDLTPQEGKILRSDWLRLLGHLPADMMGLAVDRYLLSTNRHRPTPGVFLDMIADDLKYRENLVRRARETIERLDGSVNPNSIPRRMRDMVVSEKSEGFAVSYIDRATWDGEAITAHNDLAVEKLKDVRCLTGVVIKNSA